METEDAALLLEAAFMLVRPQSALHHGPQALAVMLLAGLRLKECRGLLVGDVDWQQKQIHVQKNTHRRIKSKKARRWVPIFPQLEGLLRPYWNERAEVAGPDALLFPGGTSDETGDRMMSTDGWRGLLDRLCEVIGVKRYVQHELRHTFITHALRLTPGGMPISPGLVREWSGHASEQVQDIYTHQLKRGVVRLGEHVEYRITHFLDDPKVMARYQRVRDECMPWCLTAAARAAGGTSRGTKLRVVA